MAGPPPIDTLLEMGAAAIAHARVLQAECMANRSVTGRLRRTYLRHLGVRPNGDARTERLIVDTILRRSVCDACLAETTGLAPYQIKDVVCELSRRFAVTRSDEVCDACASRTVVHRLG